MAAIAVHCHPGWLTRPLRRPCDCPHPEAAACPVGVEIGCGRGLSSASVICLDCGDDRTGRTDLVDGLDAVMTEMGRLLPVRARLVALVDHRANDIGDDWVPEWMYGPLGLTSAQVTAREFAVRAALAAEYMAERMVRHAEAA